MGAAKKAARRKPKAAAAAARDASKAKGAEKAETNGGGDVAEAKQLVVEWKDLSLELPPSFPDSVLFDMVEAEQTGNPMAVLRSLWSILGPEQFREVRNRLDSLDDDDPEGGQLVDAVFGAYGMAEGE